MVVDAHRVREVSREYGCTNDTTGWAPRPAEQYPEATRALSSHGAARGVGCGSDHTLHASATHRQRLRIMR